MKNLLLAILLFPLIVNSQNNNDLKSDKSALVDSNSQTIVKTKEWLTRNLNDYYNSNLKRNTDYSISFCERYGYQFNSHYLLIWVTDCKNSQTSNYIIDLSKVTYIKNDTQKGIKIYSKYIFYKKNTNYDDYFSFLDIAEGKTRPEVIREDFDYTIFTDYDNILNDNLNNRMIKALVQLCKLYGSDVIEENLF